MGSPINSLAAFWSRSGFFHHRSAAWPTYYPFRRRYSFHYRCIPASYSAPRQRRRSDYSCSGSSPCPGWRGSCGGGRCCMSSSREDSVMRVAMMLSLWAASIRSELQYRANFLIMVVMGLIYQGTGFAFIWVVLSHFQVVGGWTLGDIAFLYGLRLMMHAVSVLVSGNIRRLDRQIRYAEFDRYLLRPLPPLWQIMSQGVQVNAFGDLIGGVALFLVATTLVAVDWTPAVVLYLALAIMGGA